MKTPSFLPLAFVAVFLSVGNSFAADWTAETQPAIAAFNHWAQQPASTRATADGVRLAREREAALLALARTDPARVIADGLPADVRAELPAQVVNEMETPFSVVGDYVAYGEMQALHGPAVVPAHQEVRFNGQVYPARVYGRRSGMTCKQNIFLHGVLIGNEAVLDESVLHALSTDESAAETRTPHDLSTDATETSAATGSVLAEGGGTLYRFASAAQLRETELALRDLEAHRTPETANVAEADALETGLIRLPSVPDSAYTTGAKKVLVIRVDFSDLAGEPAFYGTTDTVSYTQNIADTEVAPYYVRSSYNLTSLVTTVSTKVYRMPRTAASYATAGDNDGLHSDAETAAGADFDVSSYDRKLVLFSYLGNISGSQINYGGLSEVGGEDLWVNGEFDFRVVAHELGHTYGLIHANLWQVTDGNPISLSGSSTEYGDDFDVMGANFANSQDCDFNPWYKTQLDWLPTSQEKTVTASGTYRVFQFDGGSASGTNLALKVIKDGTRTYWVTIRRAFTNNSTMSHGVYLFWGYNYTYLNENLLDTQTPGNSDTDAALPTGTALNDTVAGVTILPTAEGGTAPNAWEDVKITFNTNGTSPVVNSAGTAKGAVNSTFSYQITATNSPTSYAASGLPGGLSVDSSSGLISGAPTQDGTFTSTISAFNSGGSGSKTITITIAKSPNAPTITDFSPKSGLVGSTVTITGTNFTGLQYIMFTGNAYAAGSYTATQITATVPSGAMTGPITVATSNGTVTTASNFTVVSASAPVINSATTASATVAKSFSYQITAANSPTSFNATGLPKGLSVNKTTGVISGTPASTAVGTKTINLSATNASGTGTATLTLTIKALAPVITSAATDSAVTGEAFSYQITASNGPTSFNATGLPSGLSVNKTTGLISGTPASTASGTKTLHLTATNSAGAGTETLTLTVTK